VTAGPSDDTDQRTDVYRYDVETPSIVRVSTSVSGGGGNDPDFDATPSDRYSMTSDGATVIFSTAEALSQTDTNGATDVYAWRDGQVSMISAGGADIAVGGGSSFAAITPSGRDIFFTTNAAMLAADGDANVDIYDARIGGGFSPPRTPEPCPGETCQGQRSVPPALAAPSGLMSGMPEPVAAASSFSIRRVSAAQRRALAKTGKVSLTVTTNAAGAISAKATATVGGRSATVGSGKRVLAVPGRSAVSLTLSKKARAQLTSRGRLTVKVAVSHSKVALDRSVTLQLVRAKTGRASGGKS
jgi:hypothetical protein